MTIAVALLVALAMGYRAVLRGIQIRPART